MWFDIFLFFQFYTQNYKLSIKPDVGVTVSVKWLCSQKTIFYELINDFLTDWTGLGVSGRYQVSASKNFGINAKTAPNAPIHPWIQKWRENTCRCPLVHVPNKTKLTELNFIKPNQLSKTH